MEALLAALLVLFITPSTLTLNGQPLPRTVDVYQLAEPVEQADEDEEGDAAGARWQKSLWIGAVIGCLFGTLVLRLVSDDDEHTFNENLAACGIVGGYGAVGGLVVGLVAP